MSRPILWVQPKDQTVVFQQPNPTLGIDDFELVRNSQFQPGDDWSTLDSPNLRFTFSRDYPASNQFENVGDTYRISAIGLSVQKYDVRYQIGKLTVVAQ